MRSRINDSSNSNMDDEAMMAHILASLPKEYLELITLIEGELEILNTLTLTILKTRIRIFYNQKFKDKVDKTALVAFKGTCRSCGKIGHKAYQCADKPQKTVGFKCKYCKQKGQKEAQCFKKQMTKDKISRRRKRKTIKKQRLTLLYAALRK